MWEILKNLLSPSQYIPHGHCYLWQTPLVWLHIASDLSIAIAYFSIPAMSIYFICQRRDVPFQGMFTLFGAFVILCGMGHLLDIWTLWHPAYWLTEIEKAATAFVSCYTAGSMVKLLPQFLSLKTPEQLEAINRKLQHEVVERQQAEQMLQQLVAGTASVTGKTFLPALGQNLAVGLNVHHAFVVADTFCETDVRSQVCNCSHPIQECSKVVMQAILVACSSDVPLLDDLQQEIGILGMIHDRPLTSEDNVKVMMQVFAVTAAELQRQKVLALRHAYEQLQIELAERKQAEAALQQSEAREREKVRQLEVTLCQLKNTQAQIVQSEKMTSLGQMVAGVAHEINNPVGFIYSNISPAIAYTKDLFGLLELYQQHYPQPPAAIEQQIQAIELDFIKVDFIKLLESMKTGADRIGQIVLALQNFSHLNRAEKKAADINQGIESTLMVLQHRLKDRANRVAIEVIKDYERLPLVECYPGQLNQVFMNLFSNAIDALEEKLERNSNFTPQIRIRTEVGHSENFGIKSIKISIADNGVGIPEAAKKCIFDPFFTSKPVGKGTGLGLFISHQIIVEKHRGSLECHSRWGEGTKFVMELGG